MYARMKTNGFWLAALLMTACTSDKDVLQSTTEPTPSQAVAQQAVTFDTYLAGATAITRAGDPGVMTTEKLKTANKGFGVFAFYRDKSDGEVDYGAGGYYPNFMYNEHVSWDNGWTYSPLKYWPNATEKDSQTPPAESQYDTGSEPPTTESNLAKLSFFAYAPYVSTGAGGTLSTDGDDSEDANNGYWIKDTETSGIIAIHKNTPSNPKVKWAYSANPDFNVDLLWGVAPAGMAYQSVNPDIYINVPVGMPLKDLVKPDKDQKVKFLFQHALSRIGLSVVSAIDQIAPGDDAGTFSKDPTTKVLIEEVSIWGDFGVKGVLNLNNSEANKANWNNVTKSGSSSASPLYTFDNGTDDEDLSDDDNSFIADGLRYKTSKIAAVQSAATKEAALTNFGALDEGVLASEKVLLQPGPDEGRKVASETPAFVYGKPYYTKDASGAYVMATTTTNNENLYTMEGDGDSFTQLKAIADGTSLIVDGTWTQKLYTAFIVKLFKTTPLDDGDIYYKLTSGEYGSAGATYEKYVKVGDGTVDFDYYLISSVADAVIPAYTIGTYYEGVLPRYIMVIPSTPETPTNVGVRIKYHVVTYDEKLDGYISDVTNTITKETAIQLENGKSYNLKLILGLTSVKLDATVADWQVADETDIWLPKNNE